MVDRRKPPAFKNDPGNHFPKPDEHAQAQGKIPSWALTFTPEELKEIRLIRGDAALSGLRQFIWEAIREKARRDSLPQVDQQLDLSGLNRQQIRDLVLQMTGQQMATVMETIAHPGYRYDVKGMLVLDDKGRPAVDFDQRTKAQAELRQQAKAVREIIGIDAPSKKRVKHTVVASDIRKIALELGIDPGDDDYQEKLAITAGEDYDAVLGGDIDDDEMIG